MWPGNTLFFYHNHHVLRAKLFSQETCNIRNTLRAPYESAQGSMMMTPPFPDEPLTLMTLPAEVREGIYKYIFSYRKPLYTARSGRLVINREARRDMQCLRTCVTFYCEAMPIIYAENTLEIKYNQISALSCVPRHAEILVGKVVIHCYHPGHVDETGMNVEEIDFGLLGQACPNVNSLDIHTYSSGSLLWITQQLSKSLPCSPIREWPLLHVDVEITEDNPLFNNANFAKTRSGVIHGIATPGADCSWLEARSSFRLGYEIPRHLKTITVKGKLSKALCRTVLDVHSCTFGDCSFQKNKKPGEDTTPSTSNSTNAAAKKVRYTWYKTGKCTGKILHKYKN